MSTDFKGVTTVEECEALDRDVMVKGYRAGYANTPDYTQRDKAYWHGYMNGQVDGGFMPASPEQQELARAYVARWSTLAAI